jgi:hypothetical protein
MAFLKSLIHANRGRLGLHEHEIRLLDEHLLERFHEQVTAKLRR